MVVTRATGAVCLYLVQVVSVAEIAEWPVRGFHLACRDEHDAQALADVAGTLLCVLLVNSIPHNVLLGRGGRDMFVFPRRPQAPCGDGACSVSTAAGDCCTPSRCRARAVTPSPGAFNAAFCEIAGLAILIKPELFDTVTERDYLAAMAEASLTVDEFVWLKVRRAAGPRTCSMLLLRPRLRLAAAAG